MWSDLVLVGGGLANGLLAYRLAQRRPDLVVRVLEADAEPGGDHTWSFHESDLTPAQNEWLAPFVVHRWPDYDVAFPRRRRHVPLAYRSLTSERFAAVLRDTLRDRLVVGAPVARLAAGQAVLRSGQAYVGGAVVDGRGWKTEPALGLAFQKFVGRELLLRRPHGLVRPILMDATVAQHDGYRFVYVLPFAEDRLLVEDTYYSDTPDLDPTALGARIDAYARGRTWDVASVVREERGILPITLGGDIERFWSDAPAVPRTGLRAAMFHPVTGYSLPDAVRLADAIADLSDLSAASLAAAIRTRSIAKWRSERFARRLNRMLFQAAAPDRRRDVLERFYGLPTSSIARFYANRLTLGDKLRLLAGKPPVPVLPALRAFLAGDGS